MPDNTETIRDLRAATEELGKLLDRLHIAHTAPGEQHAHRALVLVRKAVRRLKAEQAEAPHA